jgi:hypothetical protein
MIASQLLIHFLVEPAMSRHGLPPPVTAPLAVHALTSTLILPSSHPSSLQTYSPSSSKLISELEVSPSNRISRRDEKPIEHSRVDRAVISASGEWMATVDGREGDPTFRGEIYLKIWHWKPGTWILNTIIDRPHGLKKITALAFSPAVGKDSFYLVTTGQDGNVKTWRLRSLRGKGGVSEGEYYLTSRGCLLLNLVFCRILGHSFDVQFSIRNSNPCVVVAGWLTPCSRAGTSRNALRPYNQCSSPVFELSAVQSCPQSSFCWPQRPLLGRRRPYRYCPVGSHCWMW